MDPARTRARRGGKPAGIKVRLSSVQPPDSNGLLPFASAENDGDAVAAVYRRSLSGCLPVTALCIGAPRSQWRMLGFRTARYYSGRKVNDVGRIVTSKLRNHP